MLDWIMAHYDLAAAGASALGTALGTALARWS